MHSEWFRGSFLRVLKFLQIKDGGRNLWEEQILQNDPIMGPPFYILF